MECKNFEDTIIDSLDKQSPLKRKYIKTNRSNFITKELCKAIMQMSKLCNLYLDVRSDENRSKTDLVEYNNLTTAEKCFAEIFNYFFADVVSNPGLIYSKIIPVKVMFLTMII